MSLHSSRMNFLRLHLSRMNPSQLGGGGGPELSMPQGEPQCCDIHRSRVNLRVYCSNVSFHCFRVILLTTWKGEPPYKSNRESPMLQDEPCATKWACTAPRWVYYTVPQWATAVTGMRLHATVQVSLHCARVSLWCAMEHGEPTLLQG